MNEQLLKAIKSSLADAVTAKMSGYNSPLDPVIKDIFAKHDPEIRSMLVDAVSSAVKDDEFRMQIKQAVRHKLAKTLIEKFGGELEKQVNLLKSDPTTRAKITVAIEGIVNEKMDR